MYFLNVPHHIPSAAPAIATNAITPWVLALKFRDMVILEMGIEILFVLKSVHAYSVAIWLVAYAAGAGVFEHPANSTASPDRCIILHTMIVAHVLNKMVLALEPI
ncbi:hypothetical protein HYALB_00010984 [Hymenoscyphus albidus]|uniref:Uncharacterized protein n=1 Tax=Hymenoscyphus albidus TaxID=595503 RepID=A0A9N9LFH5_9HELO|nr:hypothetical protein HYALB_00010984 [Hymenoscyphus albidus]